MQQEHTGTSKTKGLAGDFLRVSNYVRERLEIELPENRLAQVRERVALRMMELGIDNWEEYYHQVKYDDTDTEFHRLIALLTPPREGFFNRDPQIACFAEEVLPYLIETKEDVSYERKLTIWTAGCATGQEAYTLAMLAREALRGREGWTIDVIATDLSRAALFVGEGAAYPVQELTEATEERIRDHFEIRGESVVIRPEVRSLVSFSQLNLHRPEELATVRRADVVFCRNVLSLYPEEVRRRVARGFHRALSPGGYLFIGNTETLHGVSKAFRLVYFKNALVYQKDRVKAVSPSDLEMNRKIELPAHRTAGALVGAADGASRVMELLGRTVEPEREAITVSG